MLPSNWENFTKLIYVCKNCHLHWIAGKANILCKYLIHIYIYFFNFRWCFFSSFPVLFAEAPAPFDEKVLKEIMLHSTSIFRNLKVYLRFLKSYFKLEILIFLPFVVSFLGRYVQLKSSFSAEKNISVEIQEHLSTEVIKV